MPRNSILPFSHAATTPSTWTATLLMSMAIGAGPALAQGAAELDWVPRDQLTPELLAQCPRACDGMYVEPERDYPGIDTPPGSAPLDVVSDLSQVEGEEGVARMQGHVELTQGWRSVEANSVTVLQQENRIEMSGDIRLREPGMLITGGAASIDNSTEAMQFDEAEFVLHNLGVRGTAGEIGRDASGRFYVLNATYSTCEPGDTDWSLTASEIRIDQDNLFATARNMTIRAGNIPVFYAPIFAFPVGEGRKSGLLYPVISLSNDNGLDVTQPYYLNLAPNYDLTLAPRAIEKRGVALELEARYLTSNAYQTFSGSFLPNDQGGASKNQVGENRHFVQYDQEGRWGNYFSEIDYNQVSDVDYFEDLGTATLEPQNQTYLRQNFELQRLTPHWSLGSQILIYQTLAEDLTPSYKELPRLTATGNYDFWDLQWQFGHEWAYFEHPDDELVNAAPLLRADDQGSWLTGSRLSFNYSVEKGFYMPWGPVELEWLEHYRSYSLDAPLAGRNQNNPDAAASALRAETSMRLERSATLFDHDWIQTLEPRVQYLSVQASRQDDIPLFDTGLSTASWDGLFRNNRFIGGDRIGDVHRVSLGLSTRLEDPQTGLEKASLRIGQAFYLEERQVHGSALLELNPGDPTQYAADDPLRLLAENAVEELDQLSSSRSPLIAETTFRINPQWSVSSALHLDTGNNQLQQGHLNLGYLSSDQLSALALGYRFADESPVYNDTNRDGLIQATELFTGNTNQYELAGMYALDERWTIYSRWNVDAALSRSLETLVGARYDDCCWSVSLVWRRWLKRDDDVVTPQTDLKHDSGIFISFQLKGLAGVGTRIESMLENSIPGYRAESQ